MKKLFFLLASVMLLLHLFVQHAKAQPGAIDLSFNSTGDGANGYVYTTALQTDGKIILEGSSLLIMEQTDT